MSRIISYKDNINWGDNGGKWRAKNRPKLVDCYAIAPDGNITAATGWRELGALLKLKVSNSTIMAYAKTGKPFRGYTFKRGKFVKL